MRGVELPQAASARVVPIGTLLAVLGVLGFSFKAILIKLAYRWAPPDPITLLTLRMLYSAPFFVLLAWWSERPRADVSMPVAAAGGARSAHAPLTRRDALVITALGFIGYYVSSWLDFLGLQYVTASLERLVLFLYPTIVVVLSAMFLRLPITRSAVGALVLSYAGIALAVWHDIRITGEPGETVLGTVLVFASALGYAVYLVGAGGIIARLGSSRFIAYAMLSSTVFIVLHFLLTRPLAALAVPSSVQWLAFAMAILCTVLPTWMTAESIRLIGASTASLVGSLGPIFTIGLGAMMLGESVNLLQLVGAALVLGGVMVVSRRPLPRPMPAAARNVVPRDAV